MTIVIRTGTANDHARHARCVGRALVDQITAPFADLRVDVNEENLGARRIYAALGYSEIGCSERLGEGQPRLILHFQRQVR